MLQQGKSSSLAIKPNFTMLINRKQLIDLFLSDAEDVSPEYVSKMKKTMLKKLSRYSSIDLIEQAKRQWNWNLAIARSNTFLLNL